jgi:hypothetical protein
MSIRTLSIVAAALVLTACAERDPDGARTTGSAAAADCDRACLEAFVDLYLDALVAGDPSRLPLADGAVFVENNQALELGEGTWRTVTGLGNYRHYFADVEAGQAGLIGIVEENGAKIIYDLRLAVDGGQITEIEALAIRDSNGAQLYEERGEPHPKFLEIVPPAERLPRAELVAIADRYLAGMERNDPNGDYSFFHDECDRWEHARQTTNNDPEEYGHSTDTVFVTLSCREQFETGFLGFVTRIRDRRYVLVDVERQTVFAFAMLDHDGTIRSIPLASGEQFLVPPYFSSPRTLQVGEAWRIEDGKLRQIEMTLTEFPYGLRPAFANGADARLPGDEPDRAAGTREAVLCDRVCLESFMGAYLAALIRKDAQFLPGAETLVYTENGQRLAVGDGLWGTATAIGGYRIVAADPDSSTAVFVGTITETDVSGLLFARLTLNGEMIGEIETFVVRHEFADARGGTLTLFGPRLRDAFDPADFGTVDPAFAVGMDPLATNDPTVLAAAAASFYAELPVSEGTLRERRTWVADAARSLVVDLALLDVANDETTRPDAVGDEAPGTSTGPYSIMAGRVHKIANGEIVQMISASKAVPYGMKSGSN